MGRCTDQFLSKWSTQTEASDTVVDDAVLDLVAGAVEVWGVVLMLAPTPIVGKGIAQTGTDMRPASQ
jgi:hypothetical protein